MDLKLLRDKLLDDGKIDEYRDILAFLGNPRSIMTAETKSYLLNIGYMDFEEKIRYFYQFEQEKYKSMISWGQVVVWDYVLKSYVKLKNIEKLLESLPIVFYDNNYLKACDEVKKIINVYSEAKAAITELESNLGVDRYLDDVISEEFLVLTEIFDSIHKKVDSILSEYKILFIKKWHNGNICDLMLHQLVRPNMDNQVCSLIRPNKKKVLLFIIDGLGMGQFLWSQKIVPLNKNFAYSENIFNWLQSNNLSAEYILGAPLVSDTAAGLSQIFIGKTAKNTRIFSSTVKKSTGSSFVGVKTEPSRTFAEIANQDFNSFTVDIAAENDQMKINYCSKYEYDNVSGFSKYIFDSAEVVSITPSERVFSYLNSDTVDNKSGAIVTYITNIDNSGHVMGSFSQFERYEHEKINSLFKNYLIGIAKNHPNVFDGNTSILITADHGMTESYRINITRRKILDVIHNAGFHAEKLIVANRALFVYNITDNGIDECKTALTKYFSGKSIEALVITKQDELFSSYFPVHDSNYVDTTPDIAIMLVSEGVFCNREIDEDLMHFGGHGGHSVDEVFVPAINIELNERLLAKIDERFLRQSM